MDHATSQQTLQNCDVEGPDGGHPRDSLPMHGAFATNPDPREVEEAKAAGQKPWPTNPRAYGCAISGWTHMFNSWGMVNSFGTFVTFYMQVLMPGRDLMEISIIGSTQCFIVLLLSVVIGRLLDAGHQKKFAAAGTVLLAVGLFSLSAAPHVNGQALRFMFIWITQGLVTGLGMACFFVTSSQVTATWFVETKSLALGFVATGASVAGVVYPATFRYLEKALGFTSAVQCIAAVVTATSVAAYFLCKPDPERKKKKPVDVKMEWRSKRFWVDLSALRNTGFVLQSLAIALLFLGFYSVFFSYEEFAAMTGVGFRLDAQGNSSWAKEGALATWALLAIMNGSSTVGRLTAGRTSDKFGALRVHSVVTTVTALLCLLFWPFVKSANSAIAFSVVFGAFSGAVIGLPPASMANILAGEQHKLGQWVGMMYTIASIPALIGPIVSGHIITKFKGFLTVQVWSGACLLLSACFMLGAEYYRSKHTKQEGRDVEAGGIPMSQAPTMASFTTKMQQDKELYPETTRKNDMNILHR